MKKCILGLLFMSIVGMVISCSSDEELMLDNKDTSIHDVMTRASSYTIGSLFDKYSDLSVSDQNEVSALLNELQNSPYGKTFNVILNRVASQKVSSIYRGSTGTAPALYGAKNNVVVLNDLGKSITQTQLGEELIHASQDRTYSGGIGQYSSGKGTPNIEFEAKLIFELIYVMNSLPCGALIGYGEHYDDAVFWLLEFYDGDKFPSMSTVLNTTMGGYGYYDMIDFFKVKDSAYNKETDYSLKPYFVDYIYNNY